MDSEIIRANREYLHSVTDWIAPEDYWNSRDHYGCPPRVLPFLNLPIDHEPTYTDLLVYAAARLPAPVRYLELGVSVGKNFYVLANALADALLVGFDWERMNPRLAARFERTGTHDGVHWFRYRTNRIGYLQGDIGRFEDWTRLAGRRFNLIFSDACHQPEMLRRELAMLERYELLDESAFVIVWDDLDRQADGPVTTAFDEIAARLAGRCPLARDGCFRIELNGWLGQHEHRHTVGVINNIGLSPSSFQ